MFLKRKQIQICLLEDPTLLRLLTGMGPNLDSYQELQSWVKTLKQRPQGNGSLTISGLQVCPTFLTMLLVFNLEFILTF